MKQNRRMTAAALIAVVTGLILTAAVRAQDKMSLEDLARYLGVSANAKTVQTTVDSFKNKEASAAYKKKDYAGVIKVLDALMRNMDQKADSIRKRNPNDKLVDELMTREYGSPAVAAWKANRAAKLAAEQSTQPVKPAITAKQIENIDKWFAKRLQDSEWATSQERVEAELQKQLGTGVVNAWKEAKKADRERRVALTASEDDFEVWQNQQGSYAITGYTGQAVRVVIPAVIKGVKVTEIENMSNIDIISVVIPDTVTSLPGAAKTNGILGYHRGAFEGCWNLQSVQFSDSLKTIGEGAFAYCQNLRSIQLPPSLKTIERRAFFGTGITSIVIPNGVTSVSGFAGCTDLQSVQLPPSLKTIEFNAFSGTGITSLTIPNGVTSIGWYAFGHAKLKNLAISDSVTEIGDRAFVGCGMETLTLGNGLKTIGLEAFCDNNIANLVIPDSVTEIKRGGYLTDTDGRSYVMRGAFENAGIQTLTMGKGLTVIPERTFKDNKITTLNLSASTKRIECDAFINNKLTAITIPNGVTLLQFGSFWNNPITSVVIPPSLAVNEGVYGTKTKFEKGFAYAFADFDEKHTVTSITLPANVAEFNLLQFGTTYHDDYSIPLILYLFYEREGKKKAGTYVKTRDGIWRVQYGG